MIILLCIYNKNNFIILYKKKKCLNLINSLIHHRQGAVGFCSPTPFKGKAQGLITIDNDQLVYNSVLIKKRGEKPLFL